MDSAMCLEGSRALDFGVSPRLIDSAAPAAFCWDLDLAGMSQRSSRFRRLTNIRSVRRVHAGRSGALDAGADFRGKPSMKTRAAVAFEAKKPLEIVEVDLEG